MPALNGGKWTVVDPALGRLEKACADFPAVMNLIDSWRGQMLLGQGRTGEAIVLLESLLDSRGPADRNAQWLLLTSYEARADKVGFRRVRDRMLADNDAAMSGGDPELNTRKIDHFETPLAVVDVYAGPFKQSRFVRDYVFVAAPKDGGMFAALTLTHYDADNDLVKGAYFIDGYYCGGHSTLDQLRPEDGKAPAYETVKAKAVEVFSSAHLFAKPPEDGKPRGCGFPQYMLPGVG
jgi:hypothetical protein